jgi:NAD(P)-dependent dehydrogenase (short-subunit alcohol dehydrogenase family)
MPPEAGGEPVAFVTGAAGGIGRAVVARLREQRVAVYATDLALAQVPCGEPTFEASSLDVTDESAVDAAVQACLRRFGHIDHVVHLAGRAGAGPLDAVTAAEWRALIDVNLTSAFLLARAVHAALASSRGSLVLMASTNALNGGSALSGPAYAVAKAGVVNLMRYLAKEWAAEGIRVNALAPGPIDTPMVARFAPDVRERLARGVPLGRLGRAEEVAAAVAYLLRPEAAFLTGTVHNVSGGVVID